MSRNSSPVRSDTGPSNVPETPEFVLKKKGRRVMVFSDSDDDSHEIENDRHNKQETLSPVRNQTNNGDELGSLAFGFGRNLETFEKTLGMLKRQFPTVDLLDLQEYLVRSNGNYLQACTSIRKKCSFQTKGQKRKRIPEKNFGMWVSYDKGDSYTRDSLQSYRDRTEAVSPYFADTKKRRKAPVLSDDSSDDDIIAVPHEGRNARLYQRRQRVETLTDEEDESEASTTSESEEDEEDGNDDDNGDRDEIGELVSENEDEDYEEEQIALSESDENEIDGEVQIVKDASQKAVKAVGATSKEVLRNEIVNLVQSGSDCDLLSIPTVSKKKLEHLKMLRPFTSWDDAVFKLDNHRFLTTDLLDSCMQIIKSRLVVSRLMKECERLADSITKSVSDLKPVLQPKHLNPELNLTEYQLIGLNWLSLMYSKGINCILADEMGLGKTIQVIALLAYLYERYSIKGRHLVVVPASVLENWIREFEKWLPQFNVLPYYGSQEDRANLRAQILSKEKNFSNTFNVMITTYSMLQNNEDKRFLQKQSFVYIVFDEAHMLKNMKSIRYNNLIQVRGKRRLLLTGTPLQNDLLELMSLLVFAMPTLFSKHITHIKNLFTNTKESAQSTFEKDRVEQAKKILKPFILRRLKENVLKNLPPKIEMVQKCPMSPSQEHIYMEMIENYTRSIAYKENVKNNADYDEKYGTFKRAQGMLMELRKAANHPLLVRHRFNDDILREMSTAILKEPTHYDANPQYVFEDMCVMNDFELHNLCIKYSSLSKFMLDQSATLDSGKFQFFDEEIPKIIAERKRLLLFSQFVIMLDIVEVYMKLRGYKYLRLDGSTKVSERLGYIDEFNGDPSISIFLLSTRAGGLGINLTAANVVMIHDIDFNPYNDKQAEDRCHRLGQTKEVTVVRLVSENTVEEGMLKVCEEKLKLGSEICQSKIKEEMELDVKDVKKLLRQALNV